MAESPNAKFIFVGDNGQGDPVTAKMLANDPEVKDAFLSIDIHTLYGPDVATPLADGQFGYPSAAELALKYFSLGLLDNNDLKNVLTDMVQNPDLAIPLFAGMTQAESEALKDQASVIGDNEIKNLVNQVAAIEGDRCLEPMKLVSGDAA